MVQTIIAGRLVNRRNKDTTSCGYTRKTSESDTACSRRTGRYGCSRIMIYNGGETISSNMVSCDCCESVIDRVLCLTNSSHGCDWGGGGVFGLVLY